MAAGYPSVGWYATRQRRPPRYVHRVHPRCQSATTTAGDRGDSRAATCSPTLAWQLYHSTLDGRTGTGHRATSDDPPSAQSDAADSHFAWTLAWSRHPGRAMAGRKFTVTSHGTVDCRRSTGYPAGPTPTSQWLWYAAHRGAARRTVGPISYRPDAPACAPTTVRAAGPGPCHTARAAGTVPSRHPTPASGQPSPFSTAYAPPCDAGHPHRAWPLARTGGRSAPAIRRGAYPR